MWVPSKRSWCGDCRKAEPVVRPALSRCEGLEVLCVAVPTKAEFVVQPEATSTPAVFAGHTAAVGRGGGGGERGDREAE